TIRTHLEREINTTLNLTMGLVVAVSAHSDMSDRHFSIIAKNLMETAPHIRNIGLAKNNVISHIFPLEGNEAALGLRYMDVPSQKDAVLRAIETGKTVIAGPVSLVEGGKGFISRIPIYTGMNRNQYWGLASVVINIDSLYESCGLKSDSSPVTYALRGKDGLGENGDVFFGDGSLFENDNLILLPINLPVGSWILAAVAKDGWNQSPGLSVTFRMIGSLASLIISILIFTLLNSFKRIHYLALHDPLTGLSNRRLFDEHLKQCIAIARRRQNKFGILYIDLDNFKPVNDEFGHKQGDNVLVAVSERIRASVRASDIIARVGGDEFILVLQDVWTPETASKVADKIRRRISRPVRINRENIVSVGASIGISIYPDNGESPDALIRHADSAMYIAKSRMM
ncbi:diguanylate cyclase, partial [Desulfobacterales bacterium HSG2]|nr:diguanylate cyclase [Desulfobacterales bacterium HSG2]